MVSIFGFRMSFHRKRENGKAKDRQSGSFGVAEDASSNSSAQDVDKTTTRPKQPFTAKSYNNDSTAQPAPSTVPLKPLPASYTTSPPLTKRPWVDPLSVHFAKPTSASPIPAPLFTSSSLRNTPSAYEQFCGPGPLKSPRSSSWAMSTSTTSPSEKDESASREIGTQTSPGLMSLGSVGAERQATTVIATPSELTRAWSLRSRIENPPLATGQRPRTSHGSAPAQMHRAHRPSPLNLEARRSSPSDDGTCSAPDVIDDQRTTGSQQIERQQPQSAPGGNPGGTCTLRNIELPTDMPATSCTAFSTICLPGTPAPVSLAAQICHSPPITRRMPATSFPREGKEKEARTDEESEDGQLV